MNDTWDALIDARQALSDAAGLADEKREQFEHTCGYFDGDGTFVIDPLEPGSPDLPEGTPDCPAAFAEWFDAFSELIPLNREVKRLEEETVNQYRAWRDCEHEQQTAPSLA